MWIPLYPLGFFCEGLLSVENQLMLTLQMLLSGFVMMLALPYFEKLGRWSFAMPNAYNMSFHFPTFLRVYMCLFMIGKC
jgi:very-long-chain (3R)-3-hydroxyacyl-CoA dehydratase